MGIRELLRRREKEKPEIPTSVELFALELWAQLQQESCGEIEISLDEDYARILGHLEDADKAFKKSHLFTFYVWGRFQNFRREYVTAIKAGDSNITMLQEATNYGELFRASMALARWGEKRGPELRGMDSEDFSVESALFYLGRVLLTRYPKKEWRRKLGFLERPDPSWANAV